MKMVFVMMINYDDDVCSHGSDMMMMGIMAMMKMMLAMMTVMTMMLTMMIVISVMMMILVILGETGDNCNTGHVVTGDPTPRENDLRWLF